MIYPPLKFSGEWECRHGAYLGLKYLLCAVNLNRDIIVEMIYPRVFNGLKDGVDDVVSEAAAALLPVVNQFIERFLYNFMLNLSTF